MNEVLTQLGHPDWDNEDREAEIQRKWKPPKTMKDK
jgi:hypothetical protein